MKLNPSIVLVAWLVSAPLGGATADQESVVEKLAASEAHAAIADSTGLVLLDVFAEW